MMQQSIYRLFCLFIGTVGQTPAPPPTETWSGIVLFLRGGTQTSLTEAWDNTSLIDTVNKDKHHWSVRDMITADVDFRSPMIDQLYNKTVTELILRLYNQNGAEIKEFHSEPGTTPLEDTIPDPSFHPRAELSSFGSNPDIVIYDKNYSDKVSLFHYHQYPRNDLSFSGQQFVFNTGYNDDYSALPEAEYSGCHEIFLTEVVPSETVTTVSQCTTICLASSSSKLTVATNATFFSCICLPEDNFTLTAESPTSCDRSCDDGLFCGSVSSPVKFFDYFIGPVYTLVPMARSLDEIYRITNTSVMDTHISQLDTQVLLDKLVYVNGISVSEPMVSAGVFQLVYSNEPCTTAPTESWLPIRNTKGNVQKFAINQFHQLEPIPARCVNISIDFLKTYYHVSIRYVKDDFLFAPYLAVYVKWETLKGSALSTPLTTQDKSTLIPAACYFADIMADPDTVPADNITINYQDTPVSLLDFPNPTQRSVSSVVKDVLKADFPATPEFWVDEIQVWSDEDLSIKIVLLTSQRCTDQYNGSPVDLSATYTLNVNVNAGLSYTDDLTMLKGGNRMFCASVMQIETQVENPDTSPSTFSLQINAFGCKNKPGETTIGTCLSQNLLMDFEMEGRVRVKWLPLQNATEELRAQGDGLKMFKSNNPSVLIAPTSTPVLIEQIIINGNVFKATLTTDSTTTLVQKSSKNDSSVVIDFRPVITASQIGIKPLETDISSTFLFSFTLQIIGCVPPAMKTTPSKTTVASSPQPITQASSPQHETTPQPTKLSPKITSVTSPSGSSTAISASQTTSSPLLSETPTTSTAMKTTPSPTTVASSPQPITQASSPQHETTPQPTKLSPKITPVTSPSGSSTAISASQTTSSPFLPGTPTTSTAMKTTPSPTTVASSSQPTTQASSSKHETTPQPTKLSPKITPVTSPSGSSTAISASQTTSSPFLPGTPTTSTATKTTPSPTTVASSPQPTTQASSPQHETTPQPTKLSPKITPVTSPSGSSTAISASQTTSSPFLPGTPTTSTVTRESYSTRIMNERFCCLSFCQSNVTITEEDLKDWIEDTIASLTIPKTNISAHKRKKESAEDTRPSAVAVGTCFGLVVLILEGLFIILMDVDHVMSAVSSVRALIKKLFNRI